MTVITACTNRRAHRHTLPELRPLDAHADMIPRNLINKYVELHEQPNARKQYRAASKNTVSLRDLFAFVRTYRPVPLPASAPFPVALAHLEPTYEVYEVRVAGANFALKADELAVAYQLGITLEALHDQHWHATSDERTRAEKRRVLALLRAGLLAGGPLELAIRRWGSTAWEDLAAFREPEASESTGRPRDRTAAPYYRWFPRPDVENENLTIGWPRDPSTASTSQSSSGATR